MAERLFWEELNPGDEAVSLNRTITEADVVNFCGVSGDFNWFHIDEVRASESVFGKRVAHGMLVTSVATGLLFGLATRLWAAVGAVQSLSIGLTVARVPDEWGWSYWLMIAAHVAVFAAPAAGRVWSLDASLRRRADRPGRLPSICLGWMS